MLENKILYIVIGILLCFSATILIKFTSSKRKLAEYTKNTDSAASNNFGDSASNVVKESNRSKSNNYEIEKYMHPNRTVDAPIYPHIVPLEWVDSIYDRYKNANQFVKDNASASLIDCTAIRDIGYVSLVVYCQMVDIRNDKARLRVSDPYECIWTEPFKVRNDLDVTDFNGHIIHIYGYAENGKLKVERIQRTIYRKLIS